jgi:hypothetical protein
MFGEGFLVFDSLFGKVFIFRFCLDDMDGRMNRRVNKRGVSTLVATILIILIVVAAMAIVWLIVLPYLREGIEMGEEAKVSIETSGGFTFWDEENKSACVQIKRGTDQATLSKIEVVFSVNGESKIGIFAGNALPGVNEKSVRCFPLDAKPDSIKIVPYILVGNKEKSLGVVDEIVGISNIPSGVVGELSISKLADTPEFFPALMDRRTDWDTGFSEAKLYLTSEDYDVEVNDEEIAIHTEEQNPYILLPLEDQTKLTFKIEFISREDGNVTNTETKTIQYKNLCKNFPENACPWEVKLASEGQLNSEGDTVLFDEGELERVRSFEDSDEYCERYIYSRFRRNLRDYVGGVSASYSPLKTLENEYLIYGESKEPFDSANSSLVIPEGGVVVWGDYLEILSGPDAGEFRILKTAEKIGLTEWKILFYSKNNNFLYTPDSPSPLEKGTEFRIYKTWGFAVPMHISHAAMAYRLEFNGEVNTSEDYYQFAKEMLIYDPMMGGGVYSNYPHYWASYALAYDLLKDRLREDDLSDGTNYTKQIEYKLARMMDYSTVNKQVNMWKVSTVLSWTAYTFGSAGTNTLVLSDWVPPKGSQMTGPRDWMDNAMQLMHRPTYSDLYTLDGHLNTGTMYSNAAMSDIATFSFIYQRLTEVRLLEEPRFDEAIRTMTRVYFPDLVAPYGLAIGTHIKRIPTTLYQNPDFVNSETAGLMQGMIEKEKEVAARHGRDTACWGTAGNARMVQSLFMYDKSTSPILPENLMATDSKWRPTQFLPYANQIVFRDNWGQETRQLFGMGKGEVKGNYWIENYNIGTLMYYEDGEHLFGPDWSYSIPPSRYGEFTMLADGQVSASRMVAGNGELTHYFSYPDESDTGYFVQTGQIDVAFLMPGEDRARLFRDLNYDLSHNQRYPRDYPISVADENNYPEDVTMSRQILYFEDYILLFDEMSGDEEHDYEIVFTTHRLKEDISIDSSEKTASWSGVEADYSRAYLERDNTTNYYVSPEDANRSVRIQQLHDVDSFVDGEFTPEKFSVVNNNLGYVKQVKNGVENAQFLTVISSDDNHAVGDELIVSKVSGGAVLSHPGDSSYSDTLIFNESATATSTANGVEFTGKLAIARINNTNTLTDFYIREATALTQGGIKYFKKNSGDIHHLALSYFDGKIQGSIEVNGPTEIEIYSDFESSSIEFESHPENYPFVEGSTTTLESTYSDSDNILTITVPQGAGSLRIS